MSSGIIKETDSICANFLWAGKQHTSVCKPKHEGGSGLTRIQDMQHAISINCYGNRWKIAVYRQNG